MLIIRLFALVAMFPFEFGPVDVRRLRREISFALARALFRVLDNSTRSPFCLMVHEWLKSEDGRPLVDLVVLVLLWTARLRAQAAAHAAAHA